MSEAAPSEKPEPNQFEKFKDFAARIIAVPKVEADEQERKWRDERTKATVRKKFPKQQGPSTAQSRPLAARLYGRIA